MTDQLRSDRHDRIGSHLVVADSDADKSNYSHQEGQIHQTVQSNLVGTVQEIEIPHLRWCQGIAHQTCGKEREEAMARSEPQA